MKFILRPLANLKNWFRLLTGRGDRAVVYLKSGQTIKLDVEKWEITLKSSGGVSKYSFVTSKHPDRRVVSLNVDQIEAVVLER